MEASQAHCIPLALCSPGVCFNQWAETCSVQSELHCYMLICILTDQSECAILTSQDSAVWIHLLHKGGPIRDWGRNFTTAALPCLSQHSFSFHWKMHFPSLQAVLWNKFFSFYCIPDWELLLALDWWQQAFVDNYLFRYIDLFFFLCLYHTVLLIIAFSYVQFLSFNNFWGSFAYSFLQVILRTIL